MKIEIPLTKFYDFFFPTPVVLVSSISKEGVPNVAPYGIVVPVSFNPPMIALGVRNTRKTHKNIMETKEFVVNFPSTEQVKVVNKSAEASPPVNKFQKLGLTPLQSLKVKAPSVKECKVHYECLLEWTKDAGDHTVMVGKVAAIALDDDLAAADRLTLMEKMKPLYYGLMIYYELGKLLVERKNLT